MGVDGLVFLALGLAGLAAFPANLLARASGAVAGFLLNGRVTFAHPARPPLAGRPLRRFALVWSGLTLAGTLAVAALDARFGLWPAVAAKPFIDAVLAVLQFTASRYWIYR